MVDFNDYMIFESAGIQTMVMLFQRDHKADNYQFVHLRLHDGADDVAMQAMISAQPDSNCRYLTPLVNRKALEGKLLTFSAYDGILSRIANDKFYLEDDEVAQGIVFPQDFLDRKGCAKLGGSHHVGEGVFGLTSEEMLQLNLIDREKMLVKPYFNSDQILRYCTLNDNDVWMIYTDSSYKDANSLSHCPNLKRHLDQYQAIITSSNKPYGLHRARQERFFTGEKIVSQRKCVGRPLFSYSDFDCYVTQTYMSIKTVRWNLKFLTGLLNSCLIAFWLLHKGKMQGSNYQVDKEPLLQIPLVKPDDAVQSEIAQKVDAIIAAKKKDPDADTAEWEREIDELVYDLYGLTKEERKIVEGDRARTPSAPQSQTNEDALGGDCGGQGLTALPAKAKKPKVAKFEEEF